MSTHIDELRSSPHTFIDVAQIRGNTIGEILADSGLVNLEGMIVDCIPEAASHLVRDANQCCLEISRRLLDISRCILQAELIMIMIATSFWTRLPIRPIPIDFGTINYQ